jgi:transposase
MDNLGSQEARPCASSSAQPGPSSIFLPKYSPDLNPIEQAFAKLKHLLRKANARSVEAISATISRILRTFTPEECANYFRNAGYSPT